MAIRTISAALLIAAWALVSPGHAQTYPSRSIEIIVPFSAGQSSDVTARAVADRLTAELGQPAIVTNLPGASGTIAYTKAAHAAPDGYTLAFGPQGQLTIQPHLKKNLKYSLATFEPVCQMFENSFPIIVSPNSPIRTFQDLVTRARAAPGKLTWGVAGIATVPHLQMSGLAKAIGIEMVHAPYRNYGQMIQNVISGTLDFAVPSLGSFNPDTVRAIVLLGERRSHIYPDVPIISELGYPASMSGFGGLYAPAAAPRDVHNRLAEVCQKVYASPTVQQVIGTGGLTPAYLPGPEFAKRLAKDSQEKAALIQSLGLADQ